ncbi:DEAD/DEAH box helicase family protein [Algoriphagus sp.]|uniref:DEAD/DEAH box helicase family protein n=1 Tax=Algoriphagus sp. TaxID=1872435 RepID=UPI00391C0957
MKLITPEHISNYISFQYGKTEWQYDAKSKKDIPKIQAEGSAKLWNILQQKNVALLADEVGMGKTYQALAIMITLWLQKPNAKILLYAPNKTVSDQWINEYETFIRYHYKFNDDIIKSSINGQPLRQAIYCENQLELLNYVNQGWPSLYVCKTSSLSNFLSKKITQQELDKLHINIIKNIDEKSCDEEKANWMYRFAKKCNDFIYKKLAIGDNTPFDLIVFDEAHYLRNAHADTNRSLVAHAFFAKRDVKNYEGQNDPMAFLSEKALLLTATPNHSSSKNIESIVSIFNNNFKGIAPAEILDKICVRRFRRLHNKTKHQYRKELDEPVEMISIKEKLFFAMYQRSLVKHKAEQFKKHKDTSKRQNPYKLLYGYLEGFEFLPTRKTETVTPSNVESKSTDFDERDDKHVIQELAEAHYRVYKKYPVHPKYNKTVDNLSPDDNHSLHPNKKVVFVRRIPSVFELSRRVIEAYDHQFTTLLLDAKALDVPKDFKYWNEFRLRKYFATEAKSTFEDSEEIEDANTDSGEISVDDSYNVSSKYYSLFTIKKEGKFKTTDCSNFRNRFLKELQLYSVFMHPGADYMGVPYTFHDYQYQGEKRNYAVTARKLRFHGLSKEKQDYLFNYISFPADLIVKKIAPQTFPTLFTIWVNTAQQSDNELLREGLNDYIKFTEIEKEAFANYLTKGLFFASSYLIVFYASFKNISKKQNIKPDELYVSFCKSVEKDMLQKGLAFLIAKAVSTFQIFYKKELNLTEESLLTEKWTFLNNTSPVFPVCADTNRSSILKAFNTPFYPNVLVATSVLQEGVNLHYHCNEVIHYGLAWTQGDNEQRVGRVDRLNGKMENQLRKSETAVLPIHYPYLKNTIDQDQTARFILRKKEADKLIDQFIQIEQSNEINYLERMDESIWKKSFNNPAVAAYENKDPFPVLYENDFKNIEATALQGQHSTSSKTILEPVLSALAKHYKTEFYIYDNNLQSADNKVFAIKHIRANKRHQPVIAEFNYYEPGLHILSKPVFYLRIKTPIYRRGFKYDNLARFGKQKEIYAANPILKIGFDNNRRDEFKYFICADLPVFYTENKQLNISERELLKVVHDLIAFADDLEATYMQNMDISNESIIEYNLPKWLKKTTKLSNNRGNNADSRWKSINSFLIREKPCDFKAELFNHLYYMNKNEPFVKYYRKIDVDFRCVGFYKNDALSEETKLYNYIFENEEIRN